MPHGLVPAFGSSLKLFLSDNEMLETSKRAEPLFAIVTSRGAAALPSVIVPKLNVVEGDRFSDGKGVLLLLESELEQPTSATEKSADNKGGANF